MSNDQTLSSSKRSFGAALKQLFNQLGRMLEEEDPSHLFKEGSSLRVALDVWHNVVETQTSGVAVQKARELEHAKLVALAKVASLEKDTADLRERNQELREQIMGLHKREQEHKKKLLDIKFDGSGARADVERMDLEIRDLRRRIRELEGGPPLAPAEARPRSLEDLFKTPTPMAPEEPKATTMPPARTAKPSGAQKIAAQNKATPKNASGQGKKPRPKKKPASQKPAQAPASQSAQEAPQKKAPQKKAPQKKAPQKKAPQKKAPQKKAPQKKAPQKKAPQKKAPQKKAPQKKASPKRPGKPKK